MRIFLFLSIPLTLLFSCTNVEKQQKSSTVDTAITATTIKPDTIESVKVEQKDALPGDTLFLYRNTKGLYHAIYIEKEKGIRFKWLTDFTFDDLDSSGYIQSWKSETEKHGRLPNITLKDFPREWIPLQLYHGNYYLYAPSEWGATGKRMINDSALVYWSMMGPVPEICISFTKVNGNTFELITRTIYSENEKTTHRIYVLDPVKMITLWKYQDSNSTYYSFYIPKEKAYKFDMIVNYCKTQKQQEYKFEKVDYEKLIQSQ